MSGFIAQYKNGYQAIHRFGSNIAVGNTFETVGSVSAAYVYPTTAATVKVSSSSANDTSAGTGMRTVVVTGLNGSYAEVAETVTLNGQTEVATTNSFIRIHKIYGVTVGSGGTNAGDLYVGTGTVTAGVPATIYCKALVGEGASQTAVYTIPAGKQGTILQFGASNAVNGTDYAIVQLMTRVFDASSTNSLDSFLVQAQFNILRTRVQLDFPAPLVFPEKTDIEIRAKSSANSVDVSAYFDLILTQP